MASRGGGGGGFGPPPPPAPAGGTTGAQGDGAAPPLHGSATASATAQADGTAPPLHGSATASAAAQADGTAPPLHGSPTASVAAQAVVTAPPLNGNASASGAATGYVGVGGIRPQTRGAAGAGSREVNIHAGRMPVQSYPPVALCALGNESTRRRMEVRVSIQPEQGVRILNVPDGAANPPGRHDPRVVSLIQTGAGSSSSRGAELLAQAIHSQTFLESRDITVLEGIERLARSREWNVLEEYLRQIISMSGSNVDQHPRLLLYCRRGWLIRLLQSGSGSLAIRFHQGYVAPLRHVDSLYADAVEMRSQLDVIWESITMDPSYTELLASHPGNIVDLIMDYMRLYFPEVVGHTNPPNTTNQFWAFGLHLGRESKKAKLRCLLCQRLMTSDRVGQDMARHLQQSCPKMTPHLRTKVEAFCHESTSKKRPRAAASKQAGLSKVALPSWKMLISTEAHEAIGRLARLRLNQGARYHASILRGELQAIAQLGNEPFFLAGRLEAAASALLDLMAAFMLEGQEASPALKELTVRVYKLQFLIPCCLGQVQAYATTQMVQNQAGAASDSHQQQQQHVAVPSTQRQQQVVAASSALPQEPVVAAQQQQEQVAAAQQEPVVAVQQQQEPVVAAQQQEEQMLVPLVEDQVDDINGQNVEEHDADHGDDPFNILMAPAELDQVLQEWNEFLQGGQGDPPPPV